MTVDLLGLKQEESWMVSSLPGWRPIFLVPKMGTSIYLSN
jgi:hypothetical protein